MNRRDLDTFVKQLPTCSVPELNRVIEAAQAAKTEVQVKASESLRSKIDALVTEAGFENIAQIYGKVRAPTQRAVAKFKAPSGETWSGQGRMPNVFKQLKDQGHDLSQYRIQQDNGDLGKSDQPAA